MGSRWAISVLTPDYLVSGTYDDGQDNDGASFFFRGWADRDGIISLTAALHLMAAQLEPTHEAALPAAPASHWYTYSNSVVAVIPRDEASIAQVIKDCGSKNPIPAEMLVGPYVIRGTILSPGKELGTLRYYFNVGVQDVEIECRLPGCKLKGFRAPVATVRTHLVQGIAVGG